MTMDTPLDTTERDLEALLQEQYHADPAWYAHAGLSWDFAVRQRLCSEALAGGEAPETRRSVRSAGKGVKFQRQAKSAQEDPLAAIQEVCADSAEYRDPALPLKEIVFRLMLAGGNQPKTVMDIYNGVMEWVRGGDGRVITPEVVHRVLQNDRDYGFRRVEG
jgi:hypothetical protein